MEQSSINLSALIGSRICHDLISPIGAINNGLELLGMTAEQASPEMALISESVENASARIRYFRIAFGAAGDQMMGRAEVASILNDITQGGRVVYEWQPDSPVPRSQVRLAFLGMQCLETAMSFGGKISVQENEGRWNLIGEAAKLNIDPGLWNNLSNFDETVQVSPAHVQFAMLPILALELKRELSADFTETKATVRF